MDFASITTIGSATDSGTSTLFGLLNGADVLAGAAIVQVFANGTAASTNILSVTGRGYIAILRLTSNFDGTIVLDGNTLSLNASTVDKYLQVNCSIWLPFSTSAVVRTGATAGVYGTITYVLT